MRRDVFQAIADPTRKSDFGFACIADHDTKRFGRAFQHQSTGCFESHQNTFECSLVKQEQAGREIYYHFNPGKMKEVDNWLAPFRKLWNSRFDQLDELLQSVETKSKKKSWQQKSKQSM